MNPPPSQIQLRQLFPSHLNHVSLTKLSVKGVSTLQCREYFLDGDWWPVVTPSPVHLGLLGPFQICRNSWDGGAWKARLFLCHPNEKGSSLPVRGARPLIEPANRGVYLFRKPNFQLSHILAWLIFSCPPIGQECEFSVVGIKVDLFSYKNCVFG